MIEITHLSKTYSGGVRALDDLTLHIGSGMFGLASLVLLGTSSVLFRSQIGPFDYFNPAHPLVFIHYITAVMQGGAYDFVTSKDILLTWLASGVDLLLLAGAAWWFQRRQLARA